MHVTFNANYLNLFAAGAMFTFLIQELKRKDYKTASFTFLFFVANVLAGITTV